MKKVLVLILAVVLCLAGLSFTGCNEPKEKVTFYVPDGAPALTVSSLIGKTIGGREVEFKVVPGDQIVGKMVNGEADIAIMPTNACANVFNRGIDVKLVSANVHGLLYLVGKEQVDSLEGLKGKVVYNIGQGQTPDATFRYILEQNGIECVISDVPVEGKVALQFVSEGSALVALLKTNGASFGILGEPLATQSTVKAGTTVLFDIQEEWRQVTGLGNFPQASMIMKSDLAADTDFVNALIAELNANDEWIKSNAAAAQTAIKGVGSTLAVTLTNEIVSRCNIDTVTAQEAKDEIIEYLTVLHAFNPSFVGGSVPGSSFFYGEN